MTGKTELKDRVLWYDGTSQMSSEDAVGWILKGLPLSKLVVDYDEDVELFNRLSEEEVAVSKDTNSALSFEWDIPQNYKEIDLADYAEKRLAKLGLSDDDRYTARIHNELREIKTRKLENLFRCLIYVVDVFHKNNTVWGVGRGSSCASLALFLIGLHLVDPIKYNIGMHEFFHD